MANPRSFLLTWIVSLAGLAILVGSVNLLVDPYEVFGAPRIAGISALKPAAKNHAMLAKTYQVARVHPATVLIGSSPTHIGIDAFGPQWPPAMRPVYNYGIPGGYATSTSSRTLQEAVNAGGVKNAVVFLDFQNFFVPEQHGPDLGEDDRRYHTMSDGSPNPHRPEQVRSDMFLSLATMGALIDSLTTVVSQGKPNALNLTADGSSTEADFKSAARLDGMHDLFAQKDDYELERATRLTKVITGWSGPLPNLDIIASIIAYARSHDVRLTLVISPHHADAMEIYWRLGLWPRLEQLKTELAAMAATKDGTVTLWDFMDYSSFTTEGVPAVGDRQRPTCWFWEPTHYKKQLGEVMIGRMLGADASVFGTILTPENVAARNNEVREQRQSVVCEGTGEPLLTALTRTLDNHCAQAERLGKQHGGT
jgi:hypothetical protein